METEIGTKVASRGRLTGREHEETFWGDGNSVVGVVFTTVGGLWVVLED